MRGLHYEPLVLSVVGRTLGEAGEHTPELPHENVRCLSTNSHPFPMEGCSWDVGYQHFQLPTCKLNMLSGEGTQGRHAGLLAHGWGTGTVGKGILSKLIPECRLC